MTDDSTTNQDETDLSALGKAALGYVRAGLCVFPCKAESKEPAMRNGFHDWTDSPEDVVRVWHDHPSFNIGIACGNPSGETGHGIVVIDIDKEDDGTDGTEYLKTWETVHKPLPDTIKAISGNDGLHLYYRTDEPLKPSQSPSIGIDIRADGSYIIAPPSMHPCGKPYDWGTSPDDMDITAADDTVLAFIADVQARDTRANKTDGERFELPETIKDGARDDTLFRYASSLRAKGLSHDEILPVVQAMNKQRCKPPLDAATVAKKVASACKYEQGAPKAMTKHETKGSLPVYVEPSKARREFKFENLAKNLVSSRHARFIEGQPAIWVDGKGYEIGRDKWQRAIIDACEGLRKSQRGEVLSWLLLKAPQHKMGDPRYIACLNGRLDVFTHELTPLRPSDNIPNTIPVDWVPDAYDEQTDRVLDQIACDDEGTRTNLDEMFGAMVYRGKGMRCIPVLIGESGSNGKSTLMRMLCAYIGEGNYQTMDIHTIGERFQSTYLMGKLANIGDDISIEPIRGASLRTTKLIASGDPINGEYKGGDQVSFNPYCRLVFTGNDFPRLGDSTGGMMSRLHFIPLRAHFTAGGAGPFTIDMAKELDRPESRSYLLRLGVEALPAMIRRGGMTPTGYSSAKRDDVQAMSDNVRAYCEGKTDEDFISKCPTDAYAAYTKWCTTSGAQAVGLKTFTHRVNIAYGLTTVNNGRDGGQKFRYWVRDE